MTAPRKRLAVFRPISRGAARAIVALFILSVLLSAASGVIAVRAVQGEIKARATLTQLCQSGNESRGQQLTLWAYIVSASVPPPHETAAQKQKRTAAVRKFEAYIRHVFAPRDCGQLPGR